MRTIRTLTIAIICVCTAGASRPADIGAAIAAQKCTRGHERPVYSQTGLASWYSPRSVGARTASGDRTSDRALTAAHRSLPLHSVVRVTNLENCREVKVVVNDRGPYAHRHERRILDLSRPAALALRMEKQGVARIRLEAYSSDQPARLRRIALR